MAYRGNIDDNIQAKAIEFLGREITQTELRLYPYIDFCLKNKAEWLLERIESEEFKVLDRLQNEEHIKYNKNEISCTSEFFDYLHEMMKLAYVEEFLSGKG